MFEWRLVGAVSDRTLLNALDLAVRLREIRTNVSVAVVLLGNTAKLRHHPRIVCIENFRSLLKMPHCFLV